MSRPLKILLIAVAAVVGLLIVAAIALPLLFNPNNYRQQLTAAADKQIHRELKLGGIQLSVFPWLRVKVSDVQLGNAPGFGPEPFATAKQMSVGVRLLPLIFSRKVEASAVTLDGLHVNLSRDTKGSNNWSDLSESNNKALENKKAETAGTGSGFALSDVNIGGIEIDDAAIRYADAQSGKNYAVDHLDLKTGNLSAGKPFDIDLALTLSSSAPQIAAALKLDGKVLADAGKKTYSVSGLKLTADLSGAAVPGGKQHAELTGALDYDQGSGTLKFSNGQLQAAGLTLTAAIDGTGLNGNAPKLSGPIAIKPFSPRNIMAQLGMTAPVTRDRAALTDASFSAQYAGDFKSAMLNGVTLKLDQTTVTGSLGLRDFATPALAFALNADQFDADRYLAPKASGANASSSAATQKTDLNTIRIPGNLLDPFGIDGSIGIGKLHVSGLSLNDVQLKIAGDKNGAKQQTLTARLYGGRVTQSARFGGGKTYALKTQLQTIDSGPLLKDLLGKDYVSGIGSVNLDVTGSGVTVGDLRRSLNGSTGFSVQNGAVKGFNLGQIIRNAQALFAGQQPAAADNAQKETDFASLSASGKIVNGVLHSDNLDAKSALFRLAGAGNVDLVNDTIDYLAKPTIVETSTGQGGKELANLRGVTIPILISGDLTAPRYQVKLGDVLKQRATTELQNQLEKHQDEIRKKLGDQFGNALNSLFGKPQQQPAPQTPSQ